MGDSERIAARMIDGTLSFPFKRTYLMPPKYYFDNLQKHPYVNVTNKPYIAQICAGSTRVKLAQIPWGFDQKEISFVVDEAAFDAVDVITDNFTEEARMISNIQGYPSPISAWQNPVTAQKIATNAVNRALQANIITPSDYMLREACYDVVPECTLFKVSLATEIYRFFLSSALRANPDNPPKVLDPFAGWGDRALGAAGAGVNYIGVDPNPELVPGYTMIHDFLASVSPDTTTRFRLIPFEAYGPAELSEDFPGEMRPAGADLVFSSPPFYDYEIYSTDLRQSFVAAGNGAGRNTTLLEWLRNWFLPVTDRAWGVLKPGGCLAYYLADKLGEMTKPLYDHMDAHGRHFRGVIACRRGKKRPMPLWVWQKGEIEPVIIPPSIMMKI